MIESIAFEIPDNIELVQITGGEPLEQRKGLLELIDLLSQNGKRVLLETSGQLPLAGIPDHVHISMDIKCPSSGVNRQMSSSRGALDRTVQENLGLMKETDEIKFVVADDKDFSYAREVIQENNLEQRVKTIFSPVFGKMDPSRLARLLLESGLRSSRMQLQLHKVIWGPNQRGV